jgi:hypothetical protein
LNIAATIPTEPVFWKKLVPEKQAVDKKAEKAATENKKAAATNDATDSNKSSSKGKNKDKSAKPATVGSNNNGKQPTSGLKSNASSVVAAGAAKSGAGSSYGNPTGGVSFVSAKDSELDEAAKLKLKYGNGKNLVAIGPPKRRGHPAWIQPPPGFGPADLSPAPSAVSKPAPASAITSTNTAPAASASAALHSSPFSFGFGFK